MTRIRSAPAVIAIGLLCALPLIAHAQQYPSKPIRLVSPFAAGGGADTIARFFAQRLSGLLQQQVIVDNRPGAASIIGTDLAAKAPPDGYMLLIINDTHAINANLYAKLPYDSIRDFTPITLIASTPFLLVIHPSLPVNSVLDLIKLAKAHPRQVNYASSGNGSVAHFGAELFKVTASVDLVHVPYRGVTNAVVDVAAGAAQMMIASPLTVLPLVRVGKLKALAVTSANRTSALPELPTAQESGLKGFEFSSAYALMAPRDMPDATIAVLNEAIVRILKTKEAERRLQEECAEPVGSTPEDLRKYLVERIAKYGKLVRMTGMRIE